MTDHAKALDALIEAVEAGTLTGAAGDTAYPVGMAEMIQQATYPHEIWEDVAISHDGSLDAAVALKDALLPGWGMQFQEGAELKYTKTSDCDAWAMVTSPDFLMAYPADNDTPSRALLLAVLKAYRHTLESSA